MLYNDKIYSTINQRHKLSNTEKTQTKLLVSFINMVSLVKYKSCKAFTHKKKRTSENGWYALLSRYRSTEVVNKERHCQVYTHVVGVTFERPISHIIVTLEFTIQA